MEYPSKSHLRKSGILFSILFIIVFSIIPYLLHQQMKVFPLFFSLLITTISIFSPYKLRRPYSFWIRLGNILGRLNSKLILGLFFYFMITPFSILRNLIKMIFKIRTRKQTNSVNIPSTDLNFTDQY
ncbi:conserved hypothetical protein [Prochlorococcus marinus subsp. pastoris str. CCMP1986]|uniref:SxtJ n=1 Tax=Prochlorococcus marinus subsp. pastoris (strain CCMP1986 / NIES-2087 / MED4) TaxID=59919 RepID=Q7V0L1_PROMP|nr:conserved hypothetical protein [Prochlorococcus marinus subsp. pastoris str. CCMP1986]